MNVPPPEAVLASPARTPVPSSQIWSPLSASAIAYGGDPATSSSRASATCHEYAAFDVAELAGPDASVVPATSASTIKSFIKLRITSPPRDTAGARWRARHRHKPSCPRALLPHQTRT